MSNAETNVGQKLDSAEVTALEANEKAMIDSMGPGPVVSMGPEGSESPVAPEGSESLRNIMTTLEQFP